MPSDASSYLLIKVWINKKEDKSLNALRGMQPAVPCAPYVKVSNGAAAVYGMMSHRLGENLIGPLPGNDARKWRREKKKALGSHGILAFVSENITKGISCQLFRLVFSNPFTLSFTFQMLFSSWHSPLLISLAFVRCVAYSHFLRRILVFLPACSPLIYDTYCSKYEAVTTCRNENIA